jgi:hypothetical protein
MTAPGSADVPLLERLAGLAAVPVSELVRLLEAVPDPSKEPLLAGLVGVDEQGDPAAHPFLGQVVERLSLTRDLSAQARGPVGSRGPVRRSSRRM